MVGRMVAAMVISARPLRRDIVAVLRPPNNWPREVLEGPQFDVVNIVFFVAMILLGLILETTATTVDAFFFMMRTTGIFMNVDCTRVDVVFFMGITTIFMSGFSFLSNREVVIFLCSDNGIAMLSAN